MTFALPGLLFALALLPVQVESVADMRAVVTAEFDSAAWDLQGARVTDHMERRALRGTAMLEGVEFDDGVIEVDLCVTGGRSYPGILFRVQSELEYERMYLRPHRAGLYPDAVQYTPISNGVSTWQLHHGEGYTAPTVVPHDEWFTVRMEIKGSQARVFVGDGDAPDLVVRHLQHGESSGGIGLMGPMDGSAYFSNFRFRRTADLEFEPAPAIGTPPGTLTEWEVSAAMPAEDVAPTAYPRFYAIFHTPWQQVQAEPGGLVNLSKLAASSGYQPMTMWARTTVRSDTRQDVRLSLGYSDDIAVFLNRRPVFAGRSGYKSRDPSFVGVVGLSDTVVLPLEPGLNEIFLVVSDSFGGWGFMARADRELDRPTKAGKALARVWETEAVFAVPESVLYDELRDVLYVSNFDKIDTQRTNTGFISKVGPDGEIEQLKWITGLDGPCGLALHGDRLYVVESFKGTLVEIDIGAGRIVARHEVPDGHEFLNDVAVAPTGEVYISNTSRSWGDPDVYRFHDGTMEAWVDGYELHRTNGLFIHRGRLLAGSSDEGLLKRFDLASGRMDVVAALGAGTIDGIRVDNQGNTLVSHWEGKLFRIGPDGDVVELLDLREQGLNAADFEFIKHKNLLVIPTFTGNSLVAYRLEG